MNLDLSAPVGRVLADLHAALSQARRFDIGFPGATDVTFGELGLLLTTQLLNNVGDPYEWGHGRNHTKLFEQDVVERVGDLLRAPASRWGYVTSGGSEATLHALDEAARRFPGVVVYASMAAHPSVRKAARLLRLPVVAVRTDETGRMDVGDLGRRLRRHRTWAAVVVATAGTTMTEAVDDVAGIAAVCDRLGVTRRRLHVDAALSGLPLATLPDGVRPGFDFTAGATSMAISGHKFLSTLMPCGVLVYAERPHGATGAGPVTYTGSVDSTVSGSRSGHTPLILWYVLRTLGVDGLRRRAVASRELAAYTVERLTGMGWEAWRNPHAFTVVLRVPPPPVRQRWVLADDGAWAHIVCTPGVTRAQIDAFLSDLEAARGGGRPALVGLQGTDGGRVRVPLPPGPRPAFPVAV